MTELSLDELKNIEIDLLSKIDEFCREHEITYFIYAGTLLGAVRHGGFIPWDDDIDIAMPRKDYERFKNIISENECSFNFELFEKNEKFPYPYGKICDKRTILIENNSIGKPLGVYIDVFPLDKLPSIAKKALLHVKRCHLYTWFYMMASEKKFKRAKTKKARIIKVFCYPFAKFFGYKYWIKKLNKKAQRYKETDTQYISNIFSPDGIYVLKSAWFNEVVRMPFENLMVNAPIGYKEFLTTRYGDYMSLPPIEKRVAHHDFTAYMINEKNK